MQLGAVAGVLLVFRLFLCSYLCDVFVCSGATISETEQDVNGGLLFLWFGGVVLVCAMLAA